MSDIRIYPTGQQCWGYYNCGILIGVAHLRRDAVRAVEDITGKPWSKGRKEH